MENDFISKLSSMMNDPETAEKISRVAGDILGGDTSPSSDAGTVDLNGLISNVRADNKNIALLRAITPYLRPSRAGKIESAIKAIQVISMISSLK